jgi:hypothetical protein
MCNDLLVTTTILVTGAIFFFFFFCLRCVRMCRSNNTLNCTTPLDNQQDATTTQHKKTEGTQRVTATIYDHRHKAHNTNIKTYWGCTVRTQREESMVLGLLFLHRKAGRLVLCLLERRLDRLLADCSGRN